MDGKAARAGDMSDFPFLSNLSAELQGSERLAVLRQFLFRSTSANSLRQVVELL